MGGHLYSDRRTCPMYLGVTSYLQLCSCWRPLFLLRDTDSSTGIIISAFQTTLSLYLALLSLKMRTRASSQI